MANVGPRMGLEIEYHQLVISWQRESDLRFYPGIEGVGVMDDASIAMIPVYGQTIFIPKDTTDFGTETEVKWGGLWGFQIVPDSVGYSVMHETVPSGIRIWTYGKCVMEVNTAAVEIRNYEYWIQAYLCSKALLEAINSFPATDINTGWKSLDKLVDTYNALVTNISLPTGIKTNYLSKFKIQYSKVMQDLKDGKNTRSPGVKWLPQFRTQERATRQYMCDVQVNYQVDLDFLDQKARHWVWLWNHMWTHALDNPDKPVQDPDVIAQSSGCATRYTPRSCVYRTQIFAAGWLTARAKAKELLELHKHADLSLTSPAASQIRGLMTYILASGAVSVQRTAAEGHSKNCLPQLPKTSPAAVAYMIRSNERTAMVAAGSAATDIGPAATTLNNLAADTVAAAAEAFMLADLRDMARLQQDPGLLDRGRPLNISEEFPRYSEALWPDNVLDALGPRNPNLMRMWKAALQPDPAAMTDSKNTGYTDTGPFYVHWAYDVRTSIPPSEAGAPAGSSPRLSFESRYGFNKLNIGFDPTMQSFMFAKSYLPLVSLLAPDVEDAATKVIGASRRMGVNDEVKQDFRHGWH